LIGYLKDVTVAIGCLNSLSNFDKEVRFPFIKFFNRLEEILSSSTTPKKWQLINPPRLPTFKISKRKKQKNLKTFLKIISQAFSQLVQSGKISV